MVPGSEEAGGNGGEGVSADIVWRPDVSTDLGSDTPGASDVHKGQAERLPRPLKKHGSAADVMRARMMKNFLSGTGSPHRRSVKHIISILPMATEPSNDVTVAGANGQATISSDQGEGATRPPGSAQAVPGSSRAPGPGTQGGGAGKDGKSGSGEERVASGSKGNRSPWAVTVVVPGDAHSSERKAENHAEDAMPACLPLDSEDVLSSLTFESPGGELPLDYTPVRMPSEGSACSSAAAKAIMFNQNRRGASSPGKKKSTHGRMCVSLNVATNDLGLGKSSPRLQKSIERSPSIVNKRASDEGDSDGDNESSQVGVGSARGGGLFLGQKGRGSSRHVGCTLQQALRPVVDQYTVVADEPVALGVPKAPRLGLSSNFGRSSNFGAELLDILSSPTMQAKDHEHSGSSRRRRRGTKVPAIWTGDASAAGGDSATLSSTGGKVGSAQHVGWSHRKTSLGELAFGDHGRSSRTRFVLERARRRSASYTFSGEDAGQTDNSLRLQINAYLRPISKIVVAILDLVTALCVQLFWPIDDFACLHADADGMYTNGHVRTQIIALICVILVFYAYMIILGLTETDSSDRLVALRFVRRWAEKNDYSTARMIQGLPNMALHFVRGLWRLLWDIFIFALSVGVLIAHRQVCDSFENAEKATRDWTYTFVRRLHLAVHFVRAFGALWGCMGLRAELQRRVRAAVSLNKRRFVCKVTRFDLDLTYICDRLIGMAVPCVDGATVYRNNIREVARFFASRHYGHFLIFNLCEEFEEGGNGNYDTALLYGQVQKLPMHDHNAPMLHDLVTFCEQASAWLDRHKDNVVAVHCQGGKGRTGCFCAALTLWTDFKQNPKACLDYFAHRRTDRRRGNKHVQGVAAPCQIRYVHYLDAMLEDPTIDSRSPPQALLQTITVQTMPMPTKESINVLFVVESNGFLEYDHFKEHGLIKMVRRNPAADEWTFDLKAVLLQGDVSIRFFLFEEEFSNALTSKDDRECRQTVLGNGARTVKVGRHVGKQLFFISLHTSFHTGEMVTFAKKEIDGAYNSRDDMFLPEFSVTLTFCKHDDALQMHRENVANSAAGFESLAETLNPAQLSLLLSPPMMNSRDEMEDEAQNSPQQVVRTTLHHYANHFLVQDILKRVFPQTTTYTRGQVVWKDTEEGKRNEIVYIVSGSCSLWSNVNGKMWQVNNEMYLNGKPLGVGRTVGAKRFLLGPQAELGLAEIRAWTEEVVVRKLTLKRTPEGHVPLVMDGFTDQEMQVLFEKMARDIWFEEQMLQEMLRRLSIMAHAKNDTSISMPRAERQRQTKAIVDRFRIPASEHLIEHIKSDRIHGESIDTATATPDPGSLYLFSSYIIFSGASNNERDLLMPVKNVIDVTMDCGIMLITVSSDEAGEPNVVELGKRRASVTASRNRGLYGLRDPSPSGQARFGIQSSFETNKSATIDSGLGRSFLGKFKGIFGMSRDGEEENQQVSLSTPRTGASGNQSLAHLVRNQGIVTFFFKPRSGMVGSQLCESIKRRIAEVSKILTIRDMERGRGAKRDDETGNGFGYVYSDDPLDEGGAAGILTFLFQTSMVLNFQEGQVIVHEGFNGRKVFHVLSGKVFLLNGVSGAVAKELVEGDLFGTDLLLQTGNRGAAFRAVAADDTEVLALSEHNIRLISRLKPKIGARIYRNVAISSALRAQSDLLTMAAWRTLSHAATD